MKRTVRQIKGKGMDMGSLHIVVHIQYEETNHKAVTSHRKTLYTHSAYFL